MCKCSWIRTHSASGLYIQVLFRPTLVYLLNIRARGASQFQQTDSCIFCQRHNQEVRVDAGSCHASAGTLNLDHQNRRALFLRLHVALHSERVSHLDHSVPFIYCPSF